MTPRKPTTELAMIAVAGTPLLRTRDHARGASPRLEREYAIREAV